MSDITINILSDEGSDSIFINNITEINTLTIPDINEEFNFRLVSDASSDIINILVSPDEVLNITSIEDIQTVVLTSDNIGPPGPPGTDSIGAVPGVLMGDLLRWNPINNAWEVKSEPIEFKGLVLTPALASLITTEGALYYNSSLKSILVCTDI